MITHGVKIAGTGNTATPPTFTLTRPDNSTAISGFTNHVDSADIRHVASDVTQMNGSGDIDAVSFYGEYIEVTLELMPTGATKAAAETAMTLPPVGSTVQTAGFRAFAVGPFADAMNAGSSSRFIYPGGGSIRLDSKGFATMSLPLRRYVSVTGNAAAIVT